MISAEPARPEARVPSDEWFTRSKLFLLLAAFVVMAFPTVVIGTDSFFYRDMGQFGYPLAHLHREAFWHGEIPLWNSLNNCGLPFLAQWNTLVLYPGSLIYLLLPMPWSMNLFVLAHLFLAAAGMYSLALRWIDNRFAASVAGLAFAWNGLTLHALMWPNNIAALGWMPWVVIALERAWREDGRRIIVGAMVGAMQMLTGAPEIVLLTWFIVGLLWLRDFLAGPVAPVSDPAEGGDVDSTRRVGDRSSATRGAMFLHFTLCGAFIFALCAAQLLPFIDLLRHSHRDISFGGALWSMPPWGWANFLVPLFGCTPSVVGVYSQDAQQWTSSYYMGIGTVAFSLLAFRARTARVKWIVGIAIAGLLLALGDEGHVYAVLKKVVPVLGFIRFPIKYVVLVVFAVPLLAAFGLAALLRANIGAPLLRSPLLRVFTLMFVATVLIVVFARLVPQTISPPATTTESGVTRIIFLALMTGALLWLPRQTTLARQRLALGAVLLLAALDVLTHMPRQNPVVPNAAYGPLPLDMMSVPKAGEGRAMISPPMQQALMGLANPDPLTLFTGQRRMLLSDCNLIDGVPKVNGFYSLYLRQADEVTRRLYRTTNYDLPLLDFLGVTQLSAAHELFAWHARSNAMPLLSSGQSPVFASAAETFDGIFESQFDPRRVVYLPPEAESQAAGIESNSCRVLSPEVKREKISTLVEASGPAVVVISQADYQPWKAFVDGRPAPIWKANYAYQAVLVPGGSHRLELRYQDRLFHGGVVVSALSWLLGGAVVMILRRKHDTPPG